MRVLIVGLGSIAKKHILAIKAILPAVEIVALRSLKNAPNYEGIENIYDFSEILNKAIDFAIVSNPTSEHKNTIKKLIPFKIPLFIEKPLFSSLDITNEIKKINKLETPNYIACNLRFLDSLQYVKKQLLTTESRINEVNVYCGSYLPEWRPDTDFQQSYSAIPELGGGVHIDLIHEIDYTYWLFGNPLKVTKTFKNNSTLNIKAYDYANYLLEYEKFCVNITLNYFRRDPKRFLEIVFDNETWYVNLIKNQINIQSKTIFTSKQKIQDTYQLQLEYFIKCVEKNQQPMNTVNDAFNVLNICLGK